MLCYYTFHGAVAHPWGGKTLMGRFEEIVKPQNKAIFTYRPMGKLPPRGVISKEWDDSVASTKQSRGLTLSSESLRNLRNL